MLTPRRVISLAVAALALSAPLAHAGSKPKPKPIRVSSIQVIHKTKTLAQPAPLALSDLEAMLSTIAGQQITLSCDQHGKPGIDGQTMSEDADGEVFWSNEPPYVLLPIVHVWADECRDARTVNRHRVPTGDLVSWWMFGSKRADLVSGPPLLIMLHETMHVIAQTDDEGHVECMAVTNAWQLVRQLDLPGWEAQTVLVGMQWRHAQWDPKGAYRSEC